MSADPAKQPSGWKYKGRPIEELTRDELLGALVRAGEQAKTAAEFHEHSSAFLASLRRRRPQCVL